MLCPQRKRVSPIDVGWTDELFLPCLEGECAWWSKEMHQCDPAGLLPWLKLCDPAGLLPWLKLIEGHLDELARRAG